MLRGGCQSSMPNYMLSTPVKKKNLRFLPVFSDFLRESLLALVHTSEKLERTSARTLGTSERLWISILGKLSH